MAAARNRVSLRETGLVPFPQLPPPTTELCESTHDGFAPDTQSRAAWPDPGSTEQYAWVASLYGRLSRAARISVMCAGLIVVTPGTIV